MAMLVGDLPAAMVAVDIGLRLPSAVILNWAMLPGDVTEISDGLPFGLRFTVER